MTVELAVGFTMAGIVAGQAIAIWMMHAENLKLRQSLRRRDVVIHGRQLTSIPGEAFIKIYDEYVRQRKEEQETITKAGSSYRLEAKDTGKPERRFDSC